MTSAMAAMILVIGYVVGLLLLRVFIRKASRETKGTYVNEWIFLVALGVAPAMFVNSNIVEQTAALVLFAYAYFFTFVIVGPMLIFRIIARRRRN